MIYFLAFYGFCIAVAGLEFWLVTRPNEAEPDFSDWSLIPNTMERPSSIRRMKRQKQVAVGMADRATASVSDGLVLEEPV